MGDVFRIFLRLGLTSFGGPIAHLGYFRREFVERAAWLDEATFAGIVAFCSVLPGPTSSQVGMLIGLMRAGPGGAFAAWLGFTAPSAIAMTAIALSLHALEARGSISSSGWFNGLLGGLTAAAAAVVTQAVLSLARTLCYDRETKTIAIGAAILTIVISGSGGLGWLPIALGALVGALFLHGTGPRIVAPGLPIRVPRNVAIGAAAIFVLLVAILFVPPRFASPVLTLLVNDRARRHAGVRRRPRRAAALERSRRRRTVARARVLRRLRRGASDAGSAVYVFFLYRCGELVVADTALRARSWPRS